MSDDFLADLYAFCTENSQPPTGAAYQKAQTDFSRMADAVQEKMGYDFVMRYDLAQGRCAAPECRSAFLEGLRFGMSLLLAVWPPEV